MLRTQVCVRLIGAITPLALHAVEPASVEVSGVFHQVDRALIRPRPAGTEEAGPDRVPTFRARPVRIDFSRLADARANVLRGATDSLTLNLFDDLAFPATVQRIAPTSSGGYAMFGRLDGVEFGTVTLAVNGDVLAGAIHTPLATYAIRPAGGGVHVISHVDRSKMRCLAPTGSPATHTVDPGALIGGPDDPNPTAHVDDSGTTRGATRADDGSVVDILVVYTPAARQGAGGTAAIEAHIDLLVAEANRTFADSRVIQRLNLVHREEVAYTESESIPTDAFRLEDPRDGHLDEVLVLRDRIAADLVHLIRAGPYGGWGQILDYTSVSTNESPPSVFVHEIGHNMGLRHERYLDSSNHPFPFSHGYVNQAAFEPDAPPSSRFVTIMAYGSRCGEAGFFCPRLNRFSSPDLVYNGYPAGVPGDNWSRAASGPADARRSLDILGSTVANFRVRERRDTPCVVEPLGIPSGRVVRHGAWDPTCRSSQLEDHYARYYTFRLERARPLRLNLTQPYNNYAYLRPRLFLRAGAGTAGAVLASDESRPGSAHIAAVLPAGTYTVEAAQRTFPGEATSDREPFTFTLTGAGLEFADDPIVAGVTSVKAVHVTELRRRIDALRRANGLPVFPWTDRPIVRGRTPVSGVHVAELRTALDEVYDAVDHTDRHRPAYTDAETVGAPIRAVHLNELRRAVVFLGG